jgi:very-short-patch-repair endonuclease
MEKHCEICNKNYKPRRKEQRFCSVECQYESYRKPKIERILTTCNFCGVEFSALPNKLLRGKDKYCCRQCKDSHQVHLYSGSNNPTYGLKQSEEQKNNTSIRSKKLWENEEFRNKVKHSMDEFVNKNGYYPGSDIESKEKRKHTMLKKFGVSHNWNGKYGERKCDKTTLETYGKTSVDFLSEYSHQYSKKTSIEVIFEQILQELNIPYQMKYRIYDKEKVNFWFKEYDFYIINTNILVEVDGDYWHGNENKFSDLSDFQKQVKINDKIKEDFAKSKGFVIVRFWEEMINKNINEVKKQINEIWEKLK